MRTHTTMSERCDVLRSLPMFSGCSERELARIASLVHEVHLSEGEALLRENEPASMSFVIVSGRATVRREGVMINELRAGDLCGEMAVLDDEPRCATVTACTALWAFGIPRREFESLVAQPWMTRRVLRTIVDRLRTAENSATY